MLLEREDYTNNLPFINGLIYKPLLLFLYFHGGFKIVYFIILY